MRVSVAGSPDCLYLVSSLQLAMSRSRLATWM